MFIVKQQVEAGKSLHEGIDVHVRDSENNFMYYEENGKSLPVTITVAGIYSEQHRRIESKQRRKKIKGRPTFASMHNEAMERVVFCTLGWTGMTMDEAGAVTWPCTRENIRYLYTNCGWVYEDVVDAMQEGEAPFEAGSKTP